MYPLLSVVAMFSYEELTSFVRAVRAAGVDHVIVHARKCLLNGLSTSANRTVPPLRYDVVHRLALEFPELEIVLNGGINNLEAANDHIRGTGEWGGYGGGVAGVMVGRAAYFDPWTFRHTDSMVFGSTDPGVSLSFIPRRIIEPPLSPACCPGVTAVNTSGSVTDQVDLNNDSKVASTLVVGHVSPFVCRGQA